MLRNLLLTTCCIVCISFNQFDAKQKISYRDGKVLVNGKLYCLYEEPKKGSNSFNISTPAGEVVIIANVIVDAQLVNGQVNSYYNVKFIPSGKELNIKYSKDFPEEFTESLVALEVIQNEVWNEYGAIQLFNRWSLDKDAIINPTSSSFVYNSELSEKLGKHTITISKDRQIFINDSAAYKYTAWNNWTRSPQYKKGIDGMYYRIYDQDSILQAEIGVYDHRSEMNRNISMIMMPEQEMFYFNNIPKADERIVISTAVKMLIIKKWNK